MIVIDTHSHTTGNADSLTTEYRIGPVRGVGINKFRQVRVGVVGGAATAVGRDLRLTRLRLALIFGTHFRRSRRIRCGEGGSAQNT